MLRWPDTPTGTREDDLKRTPLGTRDRGAAYCSRWSFAVRRRRDRRWIFDLLAFNDRDVRSQALVKCQACPQVLLERFGCPAVSPSEPIEDGLALLRVAEKRGLEGWLASAAMPHRSGECLALAQGKRLPAREANRERSRLFNLSREGRAPGRGGAPAIKMTRRGVREGDDELPVRWVFPIGAAR